jgi:hypothetical protein
MAMYHDNVIADESRLALYLSARLLQELGVALQLAGIRTRYERPGVEGIDWPRLCVEHPEHGWMDEVICTVPLLLDGPNPTWWFEWRSIVPCACSYCKEADRQRICPATDMTKAAQIIAEQLREEDDGGEL